MVLPMLRIVAILATCVLSCGARANAQEEETDFVDLLFPGCTVERCVIKWNMGGRMPLFEFALDQMQRRNIRHIMLDDACGSACAYVFDYAQAHGIDVCMTPIAVLAFHKGSNYAKDRSGNAVRDSNGHMVTASYYDPVHTPKVARWIRKHGGYPIAKTYDGMLKMRAEQAAGIFRLCTPADIR